MRLVPSLWLCSFCVLLAGCTTLPTMTLVDLRNTSEFPHYDVASVVDEGCIKRLAKSNKRTGDEFLTQWENATDEKLVMLWLWHNGEIREIYQLPPRSLARTSLLEGMGIAVISELSGKCLFSKVVTEQTMVNETHRFD